MNHHAYLLIGNREDAEDHIKKFLSEEGISLIQNPDYQEFDGDSFTIGEARILRDRVQSKSLGEKKMFVIYSNRLTLEAQNALLKTFEEPTENTHFFLVQAFSGNMIPTLLSRLQVIDLGSRAIKDKDVEKFLGFSPKERLDFVKKFVDKEKLLGSFLDSLLIFLKDRNKNCDEVEKVFRIRRFADDTSASPRLILEHLALNLK